jgi:hypothetical protein
MSTKSIIILLTPHFESATMKLSEWSPMPTSRDDYLIKQHLEVNATYRLLPAARVILPSTWKNFTNAPESAGVLQLGKHNHLRETYLLGVYKNERKQDTIDIYN